MYARVSDAGQRNSCRYIHLPFVNRYLLRTLVNCAKEKACEGTAVFSFICKVVGQNVFDNQIFVGRMKKKFTTKDSCLFCK